MRKKRSEAKRAGRKSEERNEKKVKQSARGETEKGFFFLLGFLFLLLAGVAASGLRVMR